MADRDRVAVVHTQADTQSIHLYRYDGFEWNLEIVVDTDESLAFVALHGDWMAVSYGLSKSS